MSRRRKNPHAVALGRRGGKTGGKRRLETLTPERRREIAQLAAAAPWGKRPSATAPWPFVAHPNGGHRAIAIVATLLTISCLIGSIAHAAGKAMTPQQVKMKA
jgi:hypothetical protein